VDGPRRVRRKRWTPSFVDKALARKLGRSGRELADERFNLGAYIDGLEDLFSRANRQTATAHAGPWERKS
jgi:hypothetical protein